MLFAIYLSNQSFLFILPSLTTFLPRDSDMKASSDPPKLRSTKEFARAITVFLSTRPAENDFSDYDAIKRNFNLHSVVDHYSSQTFFKWSISGNEASKIWCNSPISSPLFNAVFGKDTHRPAALRWYWKNSIWRYAREWACDV